MTLNVRILRCSRRLFIILVSLTMTLFSEKMLISTRCIHGFMSNLIKKSWTDSSVRLYSAVKFMLTLDTYNVKLTDYGRLVKKSPSLNGRKSTPTPKFLGTAEAYFVCHIGPNFQISLIYAFIGCP